MRKKKRFIESLKKAKKQSEQVFDNEMFTPLAKARQVREIYKKAIKSSKPKSKEIIVGKILLSFLIKKQENSQLPLQTKNQEESLKLWIKDLKMI